MTKTKKYFIYILLLVCAFFLIGCNGTNDSGETQVICVGDAIKLESTLIDCVWSSSDENVVVVSKEGIAKGISSGEATIYAKTNDKTISTIIKVFDENAVPKIIVEGKQTLKIDEKVSLKAEMTNYDKECTYIYKSNDSSVATVTDDGEVQGKSSGLATITINAYDESNTLLATKDILFYIYEVSDDGKVINNYVDNRTYEITGSVDINSLNEKVVGVVNDYAKSIIGVSNYQYVTNGFKKELVEASVGTGFIFMKETTGNDNLYYVLTNYHVIDGNVKVKIYFGDTGDYTDANVFAQSESLDLAIVTFKSEDDFKVLELGNVEDLSVGDFAIAIGNANGYEYYGSVTFGVISYINRTLIGESATYLQHDVAINPGNSGGPLLDVNGKVIGVNTLKIVEDKVDNMGFAISIEDVKDFLKSVGLN